VSSHKELDVWKRAMDIAADIYRISERFPSQEQFGLTAQLRRAAVSVPSNIAEGAARNSDKEMIRFLYVSLGSIAEIDTQLLLAKRLGYSVDERIFDQIEALKRPLIGLIGYLKRKDSH